MVTSAQQYTHPQYIIKEILNIIDRAYTVNPTCNIHIEWISGHENAEGNERAYRAE